MRSLAFGLLLVACTSESQNPPPPDPTALQMNDITVLFPLAATQADFDTYLTAGSTGSNGALLPDALYQSDPQGSFFSADGLFVVGFRLDPCFAHVGAITDPSTCDNQIRLVFQPLSFENGSAFATDGAVHVSYSLTRTQLLAAASAIAAARAQFTSDDLGPLAVNPLIAQQGLSGPYAKALRDIIMTYADQSKIERITQFTLGAFATGGGAGGSGVTNSIEVGPGSGSGSGSDIVPPPLEGFFWDLHGSSVVDGVETALQIATLGSGTTTMSLSANASPLEAQLSPVTNGSDNLTLLVSASAAMAATSAQRQAAFDAALRIENPNFDSPNTIDCASCHMAEPARVLVGQPMFGMSAAGDSNGFVADASIPAADLAVTTKTLVDPLDGGLDIHAFSYRSTLPVINQRVINETAANLAYLSSLMQ